MSLRPPTKSRQPAQTLTAFTRFFSGLTPSRVRWFLIANAGQTCRLNPGQLPPVSDLQYLQTTLKVLDDWRRQGIDVG